TKARCHRGDKRHRHAIGANPVAVATTSGIRTAERAERDWMTRCAAEETMMTKATNMVGCADPRIAVARTSAAPDDSSAPLIAMVAAINNSKFHGTWRIVSLKSTVPICGEQISNAA